MHYAEHLTLHIFITAQVTIISTIIMGALVTRHFSLYFILGTLGSLVYTMLAYMQFFNERSFKGSIKALISYFLGPLFLFIFGMTIVIIVLLLIFVWKKSGLG